MAPVSLTGQMIVMQQSPDLRVTDRHTTSSATQDLWFMGTLGVWSRLEQRAREHSNSFPWKDVILGYAPDDQDNSPHHLVHEQILCGKEETVVGRFHNNVAHTMISVLRCSKQDLDIQWGDYSAAIAPAGVTCIPDSAIMRRDGTLLSTGEMKTPWKHEIECVMLDESDPHEFRRHLGGF